MSLHTEILISRNSILGEDGLCVPNPSSETRLSEAQVAEELHTHLVDTDDTVKISYRYVRNDAYKIECSLTRYKSGLSVYLAANLETDIFDFRLIISHWTDDIDKAKPIVEKILEFYWNRKIPAAIAISDIDEDGLKWLGGNQLSRVFWEDKQFTKDIFSVFCKTSLDYTE